MYNRLLPMVILFCVLVSTAFSAADEKKEKKMKVTPPTVAETLETQKAGRHLVTITMTTGKKIEVVLESALMPYTSTNFIKLIKSGYYDGLTYHRVEPNFVIQGGDPQGTGAGGPGYNINLEISPLLTHSKGVISMARTNDPNTAGSQIFITIGDATFLDGKYAAFGWVKSGQDVADAVKVGDKMEKVTVEVYAGTEACPIFYKNVK